ncbi:MAG TPA: glycosyltransferase [Thermoanaerobaculia bacterium]|nr:glycosyltransferase [Thermoanaerobaculia bacterium]
MSAERAGPALCLLWVATKAPWPPRDGGRLLQLETLRLLADPAGEVEVTLVAPVPRRERAAAVAALLPLCDPRLVAARPRPLPLAMVLAALRRLPLTAARHQLPAVGRRVVALAAAGRFDLVHAEQAQAMPQALAASDGGRPVPVLLRAQNVESELWRGDAEEGRSRRGWWRREAARVAQWEGAMVARAALTLAVTGRDAAALARLAPAAAIAALPVPFPAELPAGPPLPGAPAVTLLAGAGWRPNREGAERFVAATWPRVRERLPGAVLHLFGDVAVAAPGVTLHPVPADSAAAFAAGSLLVVPLAVASGVRMKVLEGWARGVPVVATPAAAAGLDAADGEQLLVAEAGEPLAAAIAALAGDGRDGAASPLRERLVAGGRELLRRRHHPPQVRRQLLAAYRRAADGPDRAARGRS